MVNLFIRSGVILALGFFLQAKAQNIAPQVKIPLTLSQKPLKPIAGFRLYAGDLFHCEGYHLTCEEFKSIDLGALPPPLKPYPYSCEVLQDILEEELTQADFDLPCEGVLTIRSKAHTISVSKLMSQFKEAIMKALNRDDITFEVSLRKPPAMVVQAIAGDYEFDLPKRIAVDDLFKLSRTETFARKIYQNGQKSERFGFRPELKVYVKALKTKRPLQKDQSISLDDVEQAEKKITYSHLDYIRDLKPYEGLVLKRDLAQGSILKPNHFKKNFLISRAKPCVLTIQNGPISIRTKVRALGKGQLGEEVRVSMPGSKKIVTATVLGEGLVGLRL